MKNFLLGFALVAGVCACSSPKQNAVSDATPAAPAAKAECTNSCEAGKAECCAEKAKTGEAKTCPMSGKVQG